MTKGKGIWNSFNYLFFGLMWIVNWCECPFLNIYVIFILCNFNEMRGKKSIKHVKLPPDEHVNYPHLYLFFFFSWLNLNKNSKVSQLFTFKAPPKYHPNVGGEISRRGSCLPRWHSRSAASVSSSDYLTARPATKPSDPGDASRRDLFVTAVDNTKGLKLPLPRTSRLLFNTYSLPGGCGL